METAEKMKEDGYHFTPFVVDITNDAQIKNAVKEIIQEYNTIDVLVNNAGIYPVVPFLETSNEIRNKIMEVNVYGTWSCIKEVLPVMIKNKAGRIINISSVTGPRVVSHGMAAYAMSKGAISALTRAIAMEAAEFSINVNAILPGMIDTPGVHNIFAEEGLDADKMMKDLGKTIPKGRLGKIDDIGGAAVFLASKYADYITGQEIVVDGGNLLPEVRMEM